MNVNIDINMNMLGANMLGKQLYVGVLHLRQHHDTISATVINDIDNIIYPLEKAMYKFLNLLKDGIRDHVR